MLERRSKMACKRLLVWICSMLLIVSLMWCTSSWGVTVWGQVTDTEGKPVVHALVTFIDEADTTRTFSDATDEEGMYEVVVEIRIAVEEEMTELLIPEGFALLQSYPNPFNPSVLIPYQLAQATDVCLTIYNVLGQPVRRLVEGHQEAGAYRVLWDGRDDQGIGLGAGAYVCRMDAGGCVQTRKMVMLDGPVGRISDRAENVGSVSKPVQVAEADLYTVSIIGEGVLPFQETGIEVVEDVRLDFVVERSMQLTSPSFIEGTPIPSKYTCEGEDLSPPLRWSNVPQETQSLALICDDPDAPVGTWVHWVLYGIPPTVNELPEGIPTTEVISNGALQGTNDFQRLGYGGPCPPPGAPHRYVFKLYALDVEIDLGPGATKQDLVGAMEGHILSEAHLIGTYQRE
jgi:Raf kinase inhibitor-like YbhB/YbcL family protein